MPYGKGGNFLLIQPSNPNPDRNSQEAAGKGTTWFARILAFDKPSLAPRQTEPNMGIDGPVVITKLLTLKAQVSPGVKSLKDRKFYPAG